MSVTLSDKERTNADKILKGTNTAEKLDAIIDRAGIFGFGFSFNNKLDMFFPLFSSWL